MRQIFLLSSLMLIVTSICMSQNNNKLNNKNMKYFDIKKFEENKEKQGYSREYHYTLDENEVREYAIYNRYSIRVL